MGKGDTPRPLSIPREEYGKNYEAIFGRREIKTWNPDLATCCECGKECSVAEMLPAYNHPYRVSDPICAPCFAERGRKGGFFTKAEATAFLRNHGLGGIESHPQKEDDNDYAYHEQSGESSTGSGDSPPEEGGPGSPSGEAD